MAFAKKPVYEDFAVTLAGSSIVKATDGYRHSYGTSDPLHGGEGRTHAVAMVLALLV